MTGPPKPPAPDSLTKILQENPFTQARQALIAELASLLAPKLNKSSLVVATYIANTMNPAATQVSPMNFSHEKPLYDVLAEARTRSPHLALILCTMGGDAAFPARTARLVLEDLGFESFHVVIPHFAKSAGTALTLASNGAVTGPTSQFGPIDPQLPRVTSAGQSWVGGRSVRDAYQKLLNEKLAELPPAAQAGVASSIDWMLYQQALDALLSMKEYVSKIKQTTHTGLREEELVRDLIDSPLSHSTDVSPAKLASYGVPIIQLQRDDPTWAKISEYHTRALRNLNMEQPPGMMGVVLFESEHASLATQAPLPGK